MANKKTPLLLKLRKNSGTIYVFPSASEDVGLNLNSDINGAAITHFALLNIPSFNPENWLFNETNPNQFINENIAGFIPALSLLNYMMNLETLLINDEDYNFQDLKTVTEKCFWHWLIANKTIDPNPANNKLKEIVYDGKTYYYEPDRVNNIVKCFGSIDAGNSINNEFGIFNETYINIPSSYGGGPVFFEKNKNANYSERSYSGNSQYLEGRESITQYVSYSGNHDIPWGDRYDTNRLEVIYDLTGNNTYGVESLEIVKDIDIINALLDIIADTKINPIISYDDVNVDAYKQLKQNGTNLVAPQFDFNAILLYYSIFDSNDRLKDAYATNLFGIIFLDGITLDKPLTDTDVAIPIIKGLNKRQVSDLDFGSAYSFRVNVKTMSIYDNTNALIQDYNAMAPVHVTEFSDAIALLNKAVDIMHTNMESTMLIQDAYAKVMAYYDVQGKQLHDISTYINDLRSGKVETTYTLQSLYCNELYSVPVDSIPADDSSITFYLLLDGKSETGGRLYSSDIEPYALKITHDGIQTQSINSGTAYHQSLYKINIKGVEDFPIWSPDTITSAIDKSTNPCVRLKNAKNMLSLMFETSTMLRVKLYQDPKNIMGYTADTVGDPLLNYLYIDEASLIFDASGNQETLSCLKDKKTGFIDYVGMVPYIVALLQKVSGNFNYKYDPENAIYGISDINTIKDAIDFVMNIFHYDDMKNFVAELTPAIYQTQYNGITGRFDIKGQEITQFDEDNIAYYFKDDRVIVEFKWSAAEPNNNLLGEVSLDLPNNYDENLIDTKFTEEGLAVLPNKKYTSPSINNYNTTIVIDTPYSVVDNEKLSKQIIVKEYSGSYRIQDPVGTIETSITLKAKVNSALIRKLMDKTISSKIKCMHKCYYWTGTSGNYDIDKNTLNAMDIYVAQDSSKYTINDLASNYELLQLLPYFAFADRAQFLNETPLHPDFIYTKDDNNVDTILSMFIYFILPYYDDLTYNNVHVYVNYDIGVGGFTRYKDPIKIIDKNGYTTNYVLYRTNQKLAGFINIKIG